MPEAEYEWLVADLEEYMDCKILRSEWDAKTAIAEADLDTLESNLAGMEVDLRLIEGDHPLEPALNCFTNAKETRVDYDNRIAAAETDLDGLESVVNKMEVNLRNVEKGFLDLLTKILNG